MICSYPAQRHRLPARPSSTSARDGSGTSASSASADTTWPGMQKPHCAAAVSRNASCTAPSRPSTASPSTVVTAQPSGLGGQHQARVDASPVHEHRARAALADEAALLGPREPEVVAQGVEQRPLGRDAELARSAR